MKLNINDKSLIGISLIIFFLSVGLLVEDRLIYQFSGAELSVGTPIAQIKKISKDVRRRLQAAMVWMPLEIHEELFLGDSVFTGDDSTAVIELKTGGKLTLTPGSLIVLEEAEGGALSIQWGEVEAKVSNNDVLKVKMAGKVQLIRGQDAEFRIEKKADGRAQVIVDKGNIQVQEENQVEQKIQSGEGLQFSPQEKAVPIEPLALQKPEDGFNVSESTKEGISFQWMAAKETAGLFVLARDEGFQDLLIERRVQDSRLKLNELPKPGTYYWTVKRVGVGDEVDSNRFETRRLIVQEEVRPQLLSFSQGEKIELDPEVPDQKTFAAVALSWRDEVKSQSYFLQIASTRNFDTNLLELYSSSPSYPTGILSPGSYFWRVRTFDPQSGYGPWSPVGFFSVNGDPGLLPAPEIEDKEMEFEKPGASLWDQWVPSKWKLWIDIFLGRAFAQGSDGPLLKWKELGGASGYKIEVFEDQEGQKKLFETQVKTNSFQWGEGKPGVYYWRIAGMDSKDRIGRFSALAVIYYKLATPRKLVAEVDTKKKIVNFQWERTQGSTAYKFEFSRTADFSAAKSVSVKNEKVQLKISDHREIFWRVSAEGNNEKLASAFTEVVRVEVPVEADKVEAPETDDSGTRALGVDGKYHLIPEEFASSPYIDPAINQSEKMRFVLSYSLRKNQFLNGPGESDLGKETVRLEGAGKNMSLRIHGLPIYANAVAVKLTLGQKILMKRDLNFDADKELQIADLNSKILEILRKRKIRFCFTQVMEQEEWNYCSSEKALVDGEFISEAAEIQAEAVTIDGQAVSLEGEFQIPSAARKVGLQVRFANGAEFEVNSKLPQVKYQDLELSLDGTTLFVQGSGAVPYVPNKLLREDREGVLYWRAGVSPASPALLYRAYGGLNFKHPFFLNKKIITKKQRPQISKLDLQSTYLSTFKVKGQAPEGVQVQAVDGEVESENGEFEWKVSLGAKGKNLSRKIKVSTTESESIFKHDFYRGYPVELSVRVTGALSSESRFQIGELAGGAWFEDLLGWQSDLFSKQRWGIYFKQAQSFVAEDGIVATNLDFKYRFSQGLWNKDETVGAVLGYQSIDYRGIKGSMLGVGLLWARSMPEIFEHLFNYVPWFRHPKWVDMEGIIYPMPVSGKTGTNFNMTFHGKMMVRPEFFIEVGFGVKRFELKSESGPGKANSLLMFGTGGVGYQF